MFINQYNAIMMMAKRCPHVCVSVCLPISQGPVLLQAPNPQDTCGSLGLFLIGESVTLAMDHCPWPPLNESSL